MTATRANALQLRRLFRRIVAGVLVMPLPLALTLACSAGVSGPAAADDAGGDGGGTLDAGKCRPAKPVDAGASCTTFDVPIIGDLGACGFADSGLGTGEICQEACGRSTCMRSASDPGSVTCSTPCVVDGRRYAGLDVREAPAGEGVGAYLARMAFFEAASVDAFHHLERELARHRAPARLLRACRDAAADEVRHARMAEKLAQRCGGTVVAPRSAQARPQSMEELAVENAVEGCVRETFGVVIGMWQAQAAPTPQLRAFFASIAHDESRHAALAAHIDEWLRTQLPAAAAANVERAKQDALAALETSLLGHDPPAGLGLPTAAQAQALFREWRSCDMRAAA